MSAVSSGSSFKLRLVVMNLHPLYQLRTAKGEYPHTVTCRLQDESHCSAYTHRCRLFSIHKSLWYRYLSLVYPPYEGEGGDCRFHWGAYFRVESRIRGGQHEVGTPVEAIEAPPLVQIS